MRIEVLVGSEDPVIYPINASKLVLGSGENCDIIIVEDGISRKHLIVQVEGDTHYVIDQGSTNGSFMNEERLVPGRKVEFTSFFPIRLGSSVLISLLSDEEDFLEEKIKPLNDLSTVKPKASVSSDKTTVINLNVLNQSKRTENLVLERNQKRQTNKKSTKEIKSKAVKPKKKKISFVPILSGLIVILAAYYNIVILKPSEKPKNLKEIGKVVAVKQKIPVAAPSESIPESELPGKDVLMRLLSDIKCTTDIESYLCQLLNLTEAGQFGVVQVGKNVFILVDGTQMKEEARVHVKPPADNSDLAKSTYLETLQKTTAYLFLAKYLPPIDGAKFKDLKIIVGLFRSTDNGFEIDQVIAFYPETFIKKKPRLLVDQLYYVKSVGLTAFTQFSKFFSTY